MNDRRIITEQSLLPDLSRRRFVTGVTAGSALLGLGFTAPNLWASPSNTMGQKTLRGRSFDLNLGLAPVNFTGSQGMATAVNGSVPAPILRWREGERVTLRVTNHLSHDSSIHWHGIILPNKMDGVPGLTYEGIRPGETFEYQFDVNQSGTYWYHSHSGFQEQTGLYGAIVIDPKEPDPVAHDRDYVVMLSDWSDESPENIYAKLKKLSGYYNFQERTAGDLWRDVKEKGVSQTWNDREMWNQMRMSQRDISDVTGYTYTYLMNSMTPDDNWSAVFNKGERVRLRFINGAAMTIFDVRIPGLKMTVVAADGQNVSPVTVDEFRIGVAETYDVIVEPASDSAYTIFAQTIDRSGFARGTLSANKQLSAAIPKMDPAPILTHRDMGMSMSGMAGMAGMEGMTGMDHGQQNMGSMGNMAGMDHSKQNMGNMGNMAGMDHSKKNMGNMGNMTGMDHSQHNMAGMGNMAGMDHGKQGMAGMDMSGMQVKAHCKPGDFEKNLGKAGYGSDQKIVHVDSEFGPQVDMRAADPANGLTDPGIGLRDHQKLYGRKVLTYADLCGLSPTRDKREPSREIQIHLTGNMNRYMWSIDGIKFADAEPVHLKHGERVRITLVNDTMMTHPIHLHGLWSELETGDPNFIPRKHTVLVQPGSKISYLVTADALGRWAYHCHLLYHMPGMFREVRVS